MHRFKGTATAVTMSVGLAIGASSAEAHAGAQLRRATTVTVDSSRFSSLLADSSKLASERSQKTMMWVGMGQFLSIGGILWALRLMDKHGRRKE